MDRNDLRWVLDASETHYRVILMHFCLVLVGSPYSFGAKSGQNGLNLDQNGLSKVPAAAGKCWQSAFLVTKMRFASLCQHYFILLSGWVGGFPAYLPVCHRQWRSKRTCAWHGGSFANPAN